MIKLKLSYGLDLVNCVDGDRGCSFNYYAHPRNVEEISHQRRIDTSRQYLRERLALCI